MKKLYYYKPQLNTENYCFKDAITASDMRAENYDHFDNRVTVSGGGFRIEGDSLIPSYYG
ncbi:MAG: hypothetical protein K6F76_05355 [Clostridiales bacterium]|nr:hypothetical protein [Clostridiales bacterium]